MGQVPVERLRKVVTIPTVAQAGPAPPSPGGSASPPRGLLRPDLLRLQAATAGQSAGCGRRQEQPCAYRAAVPSQVEGRPPGDAGQSEPRSVQAEPPLDP